MADTKLRVAIDCDDAAIELKKIIYNHLKDKGCDITDLDWSSCDPGAAYPDIGYHLARQIQAGTYDRGILICGTGIGMVIIANKVEGVYAGLCHDVFSAERLAKSNNANVLTMGARVIGPELAKMIVDAWLNAEFQPGRSSSKVEKICSLEKQSFHPGPSGCSGCPCE